MVLWLPGKRGNEVGRLLSCILKGELGFPRQNKMGKGGSQADERTQLE